MLARSDVKTPLIVLLVFSLIAELCLLAGITQSAIGGYIGLLMQQSSLTPCSNYLKFKVETLNTYMYNIIFFCACGAAVVSIAFLVVLVRLVIKVRESQNQQFPEFTLNTFYLLYIVYSIAILLAIPGAGFYFTLIIQKGKACLGSYQLYWLTIGGVFIIALFLLLICWIYLFILKLRLQDKFQEKEEKQQPLIPENLIKIPQQVIIEPSMGNMLDLILMQQRLKDNQQHKTQLKQPLVAQVDSDDQASLQEGEKEKIVCVDYGQYKRKQQAIKKKEEQDQRLIQELIALEIAKRQQIERQEAEKIAKEKQKKKLLNMALSPNDEGFDKIFQQSEKQDIHEQNNNQSSPSLQKVSSPSNSQKSSILQQPFYPANYVPINEQDQRKFKQYKKKLLQKYNIQKPKKEKRHLQNIDGGRSRRQLQRAVNAHKKPPRTVQYYESLLKNSNVTPIQEIKNSETYSSQQEDKQSALSKSNQHQNTLKPQPQQTPQAREQPSMMAPDFIQPHLTDRDYDEEKKNSGILLFEKRAEKSPMRKKLFDQEANYLKSMNMGSVLGTLVKGVVQSTHHSRLMRLREQKNADKDPFYIKRRKNEKIIDFIRSKYS